MEFYKKYVIDTTNPVSVYNFLIDAEIVGSEALDLVTNINGMSIDTLNDVIAATTPYKTIEYMLDDLGMYSMEPEIENYSITVNDKLVEFIWDEANVEFAVYVDGVYEDSVNVEVLYRIADDADKIAEMFLNC